MPVQIIKRAEGRDTITYTVRNFEQLNFGIRSPVEATPIPETASEAQILVKVFGNSANVLFSWTIKDEDADTFSGLSPGISTRTMSEQVRAIREYLVPKTLDDKHELRVTDENDDVLFSWVGSLVSIGGTIRGDNPLVAMGTVEILEGDVITFSGNDGPTEPLSVMASTGTNAGEIDVEWSPPQDTGTGSPSITSYIITYQSSFISFEANTGSTATSYTLTNLLPGIRYDIRVRAVTTLPGKFSDRVDAVAQS